MVGWEEYKIGRFCSRDKLYELQSRGYVMNRSEVVAKAMLVEVINRASKSPEMYSDGNDVLTEILRGLLYVAFYSDKVDVLKGLSNEEKDISHEIASAGVELNEQIVEFSQYSITLKDAYDVTESNFMNILQNHLKHDFPLPEHDLEKFSTCIFEFYQMVEIMLIVNNKPDLLEGLKSIFSDEERDYYDEIIECMNKGITQREE